ncbi:hypothetical protein AB0H20_13570 [Nocardia fluminea]|uniref:hypothetical protein n=1 Tax=Nocardia fluminea TaxID=134984 RepID=UPI0033D714CE
MTRTRTPRPSEVPRTVGGDLVNARLVFLALTIGVTRLFVIPLVLLPLDTAWGWALLPLTLTITPVWSLIHEAVHGSLQRNRARNDRMGRILAVVVQRCCSSTPRTDRTELKTLDSMAPGEAS